MPKPCWSVQCDLSQCLPKTINWVLARAGIWTRDCLAHTLLVVWECKLQTVQSTFLRERSTEQPWAGFWVDLLRIALGVVNCSLHSWLSTELSLYAELYPGCLHLHFCTGRKWMGFLLLLFKNWDVKLLMNKHNNETAARWGTVIFFRALPH